MSKIKELERETETETETKTESKAVTVAETKLRAAPETTRRVDPFENYADQVAPQNIVGTLLVFNKGDYLAGKSKVEIPAGTRFTAGMDLMAVGFVKWQNNKPADHALVRVAEGKPLPRRRDLGDHDQDVWEIGLNGKAKDPWQEVNYLPLLDNQGEMYTFVVSGISALKEAGHLSRAYAQHRKLRPIDFPLIALDVDSYLHSDRSVGRVKYPTLHVIGWTSKIDFMKALAVAGLVPDDAVSAAADEAPATAKPRYSPDRITSGPQRTKADAIDDEPPAITELPPARDPDDDIDF
jgi:hypothetical protein